MKSKYKANISVTDLDKDKVLFFGSYFNYEKNTYLSFKNI